MKQLLRQLGIGGALIVTVAGTPIIPSEMELLYSYKDDCVHPELLVGTATTSAKDPRPYKPNCTGSETEYAVSVFADRQGNKVYIQIPLTLYEDMGKIDGILKNPKRSEYINLFEALMAQEASASIARDSYSTLQYGGTASSITFSHTTSGTDRAIVVGSLINDAVDTVSGMTYNGVSLTQFPTGSPQSQSGGAGRTERLYMYALANPDSGTHNVVITCTGGISNGIFGWSVSYSGVDQTTPIDASAGAQSDSANTLTVNPVSSVDNTWAVTSARHQGANVDNGTNYTAFYYSSVSFGDSNGDLGTAGTETITVNNSSTYRFMVISGLLKPASGGGAPAPTPPAEIIWFD